MAISIGDALLTVGADTKPLDKAMKGIGATLKKHQKAIGIGMVAMGGAILAAGALSIKTFAEMGDEIQKMALRTDFATESLSEWKHVLEISGSSLQALDKGVKKMSKTIVDASDGLATYVRSFEKIGLTAEELMELSPEEQFEKIAMAIASLESHTIKAAVAQEIFGRAGTELLPMLDAGADGIRELREEAHKLGIVFDQEAADKAAEFTDAMHRVEEATSGLKFAIADILLPTLLPLIDNVKEIISGFTAWAEAHPELMKRIVLITGLVGLLLIPLGTLLILLPTLTTAFGIMSGFITATLIPVIVGLISVLWAKVAALYAVMVAMGPVGWALAAASMAMITAGLILLHKEHNKQLRALTDTTEKHTTAIEFDIMQLKLRRDEEMLQTEAIKGTTEALGDQLAMMKKLMAMTRKFRGGVPSMGLWTEAGWEWALKRGPEVAFNWARYRESLEARRGLLAPPGLQVGGLITKTGIAEVHKGERWPTPEERQMRMGDIHIYLNGRELEKMYSEMIMEDVSLQGAG